MKKVDGTPQMPRDGLLEHWWQFTLYPPGCLNKIAPVQVFSAFLPAWLAQNPSIERWHVLFEPSALVRFIGPPEAMDHAMRLADSYGLMCKPGDAAPVENRNRDDGATYQGEADVYGPDLWDINKRFMQVCGELSIELAKHDPVSQAWVTGKFVHLMCNILGMTLLEEIGFHDARRKRMIDVFERYGRQ